MGSYRDSVLSESARNSDLMFLYRKLDWGNPYISLAYWIGNDQFAERIRAMVRANSDITNESVLLVMRGIFDEYKHEVEIGHEPDFNFAMAKKVMKKLESASQVEPWSASDWDRAQWKTKVVFPAGFEEQSYIEGILTNAGIRHVLVQAICMNLDILTAVRKFGSVSTVAELETIINAVYARMVAEKYYKQSGYKGRFFKLRRIVTELKQLNVG